MNIYLMEHALKHSFSFQMLEEQNVKFYMKDGVTEIQGENGKVAVTALADSLKCYYAWNTIPDDDSEVLVPFMASQRADVQYC